jgi:hypothetical protein
VEIILAGQPARRFTCRDPVSEMAENQARSEDREELVGNKLLRFAEVSAARFELLRGVVGEIEKFPGVRGPNLS